MARKTVSACLLGEKCRHDGGSKADKRVISLSQKEELIPVCPEQLGGLPTPRTRSEIAGGDGHDVLAGKAKVIARDGRDVSSEFLKGAYVVLDIAQREGAREAILKSDSPSCGCGKIHDGAFSGKLKEGDGVTAALLKENGIMVKSEETFFLKTRAPKNKAVKI